MPALVRSSAWGGPWASISGGPLVPPHLELGIARPGLTQSLWRASRVRGVGERVLGRSPDASDLEVWRKEGAAHWVELRPCGDQMFYFLGQGPYLNRRDLLPEHELVLVVLASPCPTAG